MKRVRLRRLLSLGWFLIPMALLLIREPVASGVWQTAKSGFVVVAMGLNGKPDR